MSGRDDLKASMRAIMAARRNDPRVPPDAEELLDDRDSRLEEKEHERVEAKLDAFPDVAQALADLAAFPQVRPVEGVAEITDEELGRRWEGFRHRLEAKVEPAPLPRHPRERVPRRRFRWPLLAAAGIAFLAVGLAGGYRLGRSGWQSARAPLVNVSLTQLSPEDGPRERDGARTIVEPSAPSSAAVLVLLLPADVAEPSVAAVLHDPRGLEVWSATDLRPTPQGTLQIAIPGDFLAASEYRLTVFSVRAGGKSELATYSFRWLGG